MKKGAIKTNLPAYADLARAWDSGEAIKRVKAWASDSEGKIDYTKYSEAFAWVDDDAEKQSSYKLPVADVINGELKFIWQGVKTAMATLLGEKSGIELSADATKSIYDNLSTYYKQFEQEAPELPAEKGAVADELAQDAAQEKKQEAMRDVWEVFYAFCDVFYNDDTPVDDFNTLLTETIGILGTIVEGTYESTDPEGSADEVPIAMYVRDGVDDGVLGKLIQTFIDTREPRQKKVEPLDRMKGALTTVKTADDDEVPVYQVKASYDAKEKIAVASTDVYDRQGERINQEGWELKNFKSNPVLLWAHDHTEISIGNAKNIHIERKNGKPQLVFTPDFHEATDKARALKLLYEQGRMNSFSVGFIPKDMDGATATYLKQELLEISAVNVPANPEAMMSMHKSLSKAGIEESVIAELGIKKTVEAPAETPPPEGDEIPVLPVVDKPENTPEAEDKPNQNESDPVKVQDPSSTAPTSEATVRAEQSLVKVIARASDRILQGEKIGQTQEERVKLQKVIKRAAEILSVSQRRKLEDGKTR
jgi:HK97 family phage prohead protease